MSNPDREQLALWVEKHLDDSLESEEFDRLQKVLMDQPGACELYLDLMQQNAHLQLESVRLSATSPRSIEGSTERSKRSQAISRKAWLSALTVLISSFLLIAWWNWPLGNSPDTAPSIARITDSSDAQWGECSLPTAIGSELKQGRLQIERGLATIRFASGAEVTLESPAILEIDSPLAGRLLAGTAIVEVPDSAHGFTLTTPTAVAIDYGTAFAVTVDTLAKTSSIEVLDGEVEVQHIASQASRRLNEKQRVVASEIELSDSSTSTGEAKLSAVAPLESDEERLYRITTADGGGGDVSVSHGQDQDVKKNNHPELILIKNPFEGFERFGRKGYFRFDLTSLPERDVTTARLTLTLMPSGLGYASKVGDCEFTVYGLADETGDDWSDEKLTWQNAPANLDGAAQVDANRVRELGRFIVRRGVQHGQVSIAGEELVQFLNADTNQSITLIVVRETKELEPGGLVHGFTNQSSSVGNPPTLTVSVDDQ